MAVLGLRFCVRALSSCGKWGPLFIAARRPLIIAASPVAEHRLQTRRLSNCGSRAQSLRGMWDPPRPGFEPVSPALAGRLSTTAPPGKPLRGFLMSLFNYINPAELIGIFSSLNVLKKGLITTWNFSLHLLPLHFSVTSLFFFSSFFFFLFK